MKKKLCMILVTALTSIALFGCGKETTQCDPVCSEEDYCGGCGSSISGDVEYLETTDPEAQTTIIYKDGSSFSLYSDATDILKVFGEPESKCEYGSFVNNVYDGFTVEYETTNGYPQIDNIVIENTDFEANGIKVGTTADAISDVLGCPSDECESDGTTYLYYFYDGFTLYFTIENEKVIDFTYSRSVCDIEDFETEGETEQQ